MARCRGSAGVDVLLGVAIHAGSVRLAALDTDLGPTFSMTRSNDSENGILGNRCARQVTEGIAGPGCAQLRRVEDANRSAFRSRADLISGLQSWKQGSPPRVVVHFLDEVFAQYLAADESFRQAIRSATTSNYALCSLDEERADDLGMYWSYLAPVGVPLTTRGLSGCLTSVSIQGAWRGWSATHLLLDGLIEEAQTAGIAWRQLFQQVALTADDRLLLGHSELTMRGLFDNAVDAVDLMERLQYQLEDRNAGAVSDTATESLKGLFDAIVADGRGTSKPPSRTPWWLIW